MKRQALFHAPMLIGLVLWAPWSIAPTRAQTPQTGQVRPDGAAARAVDPQAAVPARRVQLPGLPHFATVSGQLHRGGQPEDKGFAELRKRGIGIVVNLRHESDEIVRERALVEAQGMRYVSIPWRGKEDPRTRQVAQFLELLRANADVQVFVHCERGAERTGVMVACYRIAIDNWTPKQALDEMEDFRFRGLFFGHLKRFVRAFPTLLLSDPFLKNAR